MSQQANAIIRPTPSNTPRTGQQYSIHFGDYSAVITQLGAILRRFDYQSKEVIVPFGENDTIPCCNGYVLVPYPNRVEDGEYSFEGVTYQMPIDEVDRQTAIHGFGYRYMWNLETLTESSVSLSWRSPNLTSYPFDIIVTVLYELNADGLTMSTVAYNNGSIRAPWAFGIHPWLSNGGNGENGIEIEADNAKCRLNLPCNIHVTVNPDRLLPTGEESVANTQYDLRDNPTLAGRPFDDAWSGVQRDEEGNTTAVFTRPDGLQVSLRGDNTIHAWQVCTATGFPEGQHPAGVAVEPMTAYANALRTGKDLVVIEPDACYQTTIHYHAEQLNND